MAIKAYDYKGKWFVLMDEDRADEAFDFERPDVNLGWAMNEGLGLHLDNCDYYGIPAYVGSDEEFKKKIASLSPPLLAP